MTLPPKPPLLDRLREKAGATIGRRYYGPTSQTGMVWYSRVLRVHKEWQSLIREAYDALLGIYPQWSTDFTNVPRETLWLVLPTDGDETVTVIGWQAIAGSDYPWAYLTTVKGRPALDVLPKGAPLAWARLTIPQQF